MVERDICVRNPVRVLERALEGGLGSGNIGVVLARTGVGKTGFLIGIALDALLQGRKVLHISTKESVERLRKFYDTMYGHLAEDLALDRRLERRLQMERNRHILVYNRKQFSLAKLEQSVAFLRESAHFEPALVIMDGTPRFEKSEEWEIEGVRKLAGQWSAEVWTASITHREGQQFDARGIPLDVARFDPWLAVVLKLEPQADHIRVRILKDRDRDIADVQLELDPRTLLLRWH
jgi:hypothetical protein